MKKVLYFTIILISFFLFETTINALDYDNVWVSKNLNVSYNETILETDNGYILGGYNKDSLATIVMYDNKGKEVHELTIENQSSVIALGKKEDNIYAVVIDDFNRISVYKLDINLLIKDSIKTNYYLADWNDIVYFNENYISITSLGWNKFEGISDEDDNNRYSLLTVSYDLKEITPVSSETLIDYYPSNYDLMFKISNYETNGVPIALDYNGDNTIIVGKNSSDGKGTFINFYNKDQLVKQIKVDDTTWYYANVSIVEDKAYVVGNEYKNLEVYSLDGKLLESVDLSELYTDQNKDEISISSDRIIKTNSGFVLTAIVCDIRSDNCKNSLINYERKYNILIKTDGNGEVEVTNEQEYFASDVKFTIKPKKGFVLGNIVISDSNGNKIAYNDYTFEMPNSNVTIEASFVLEEAATEEEKNFSGTSIDSEATDDLEGTGNVNPETDAGIFGTCILLVISFIALIISYKRFKRLV